MSTSGSKSNEHVAHFLVDIHIWDSGTHEKYPAKAYETQLWYFGHFTQNDTTEK